MIHFLIPPQTAIMLSILFVYPFRIISLFLLIFCVLMTLMPCCCLNISYLIRCVFLSISNFTRCFSSIYFHFCSKFSVNLCYYWIFVHNPLLIQSSSLNFNVFYDFQSIRPYSQAIYFYNSSIFEYLLYGDNDDYDIFFYI